MQILVFKNLCLETRIKLAQKHKTMQALLKSLFNRFSISILHLQEEKNEN